MSRDPGLLSITASATILFACVALFFGTFLRRISRGRRLKLPHRNLELIFRLWFAALALASFYLTVHILRS